MNKSHRNSPRSPIAILASVASLLIGTLLHDSSFASVEQYTAEMPAPEPTAEETLALELINRFRADPIAEAALLATKPYPRTPYEGLDIEQFVAEMQSLKPAQPLVFHPRLIGASRNHLAYTLAARDYGHDETPSTPEFTGANSQERALFAGYPASRGQVAECTGAYVHGGILGNHWALIVDDGPGGDHGMQAGRGHRMTLVYGGYREFGVGNIAHPDGRWGDASLCSPAGGQRLVGGVAFFDFDGDDFYDIGEGSGGLRIEILGSAATRTWESGAYRLEVRSEGKLKIRASLLDLVVTGDAPASTDNYKFDVELLEPVRAHMRQLQDALTRGGKTSRRKALLDLTVWSSAFPQAADGLDLDAEVVGERKIWEKLCEQILAQLQSSQIEALELKESIKSHRDTLMGDWFSQAQSVADLIQERISLEASRGNAKTKKRKQEKLLEQAAEVESNLQDLRLRALYQLELIAINACIEEEIPL